MRIQFVGNLTIEDMFNKLIEVASSTAERVEKESHGTKINGFEIHDAEFTVKYLVEGVDEPQVLTIEHHKGYPEMFTWIVNAENGESKNNETESQFDEYTVAKSKGKEHEFAEIVSEYVPFELEDLDEELTEDYGDMAKKVYNHPQGFKVVQVYQKGKLIQEYKLTPKQ